ncbi:MAG TPA: hypothetical protein VKE74_22940 [Gemmataceae bacterium]|nr:hypothetical protein [Gemmataceae bacterium]
MTKFIRCLVFLAVVAGVIAAAGLTIAPAQDKTKKDAKEEIGKVEVYMAKDGWRWKVTNAEGKAIAIGTIGFDKKEEAVKAVEAVKTTLNKAKVEVVVDKDKK